MDLRIGYVAGRGYDDRDSSVPAERQVLGEMAEVPNRSYGGVAWRQMALVSNSALLCLFMLRKQKGEGQPGFWSHREK